MAGLKSGASQRHFPSCNRKPCSISSHFKPLVRLPHSLAQLLVHYLQVLGCSSGFLAWSTIACHHRRYHHSSRRRPSFLQLARKRAQVQAVEGEAEAPDSLPEVVQTSAAMTELWFASMEGKVDDVLLPRACKLTLGAVPPCA